MLVATKKILNHMWLITIDLVGNTVEVTRDKTHHIVIDIFDENNEFTYTHGNQTWYVKSDRCRPPTYYDETQTEISTEAARQRILEGVTARLHHIETNKRRTSHGIKNPPL